MPGVFTHGDFDTWSPGYLMFLAGLHNGVSRLYETFGNGGADTEKRILKPEEYSRTWYRQNPPPANVMWSQRNNNNYEESALLTTLAYYSRNTHHFLENFYIKSKRSIQKPMLDGPAAYILSANPAELNRQLQLLSILKLQHVDVHQLSQPFTGQVPVVKKAPPTPGDADAAPKTPPPTVMVSQTFPAGSFVVRMDQPYSRIADALLDTEYWAADDPQKHPYDDTGWSYSQLFNVKVARIKDPAILKETMVAADLDGASGKVSGSGSVFAVAHTGQTSLLALVYQLKGAHIEVADKAFDVDGAHFNAGSLLITHADDSAISAAVKKLGLDAARLSTAPSVATHTATAPRIAFMHTWLGTQTEGWWRLAFDKLGVPYDYISTQKVSTEADLRAKYDVIVFAPVGRASSSQIIQGLPMWGNALPWQKTELTPNLTLDSTPDTRPGLGYSGLEHLKAFVQKGGLLITCEDSAQFAVDAGLAPGVSVAPRGDARVVGSVLGTVVVNAKSPILYGYNKPLTVYSEDGLALNVSNTVGGTRGPRLGGGEERTTGRGGPDDPDVPQGRPYMAADPLPKPRPWEPMPLNEEQMRNNPNVIPAELRPEVLLRYADKDALLVSGLLDHGDLLAQRAVVVAAHLGKGSVLLFANNPIYRGETIGSYPLVFNAILNFDQLGQTANSTH